MNSQYTVILYTYTEHKSVPAILLLVNKVEIDNSRIMAKLFGKKYYKYSSKPNDETLCLLFPYITQLNRSFMNYTNRTLKNNFISIDLDDFIDEDIKYEKKLFHAKIHKDLYDMVSNMYPIRGRDGELEYWVEDEELRKFVGNKARPAGIPITKENQRTYYKAYYRCFDYHYKMKIYKKDRMIGKDPFASKAALCKEDCLFPTCPFYDFWAVNNRFNPTCEHKSDYDVWVVKGYKERFKK